MQIYQKQYKQRKSDNWEEFDNQLDKNVIVELLFTNKHTQYIKRALIIIAQDLETELEYKD